MKRFGQLIAVGVFLYLLFLYRTELTGYISSVSLQGSRSTIEQASWAGLRTRAHQAYELSDHDTAIALLGDYLQTVTEELRRHDYQQKGMLTTRHDVICELSDIHRKLSDKYYLLSDEDNYYNHWTKHRAYLTECTEKVSRHDG